MERGPRNFPKNYDIRVQRLENLEKRLLKNIDVAESNSKNIEDYQEKGYISKVELNTDSRGQRERSWFFPNFPIV